MSKLDQIIRSIIDDTPTGEISNVINDLKVIVDRDISSELEESIAQYNIDKFVSVETSKGDSIILSEYNKESADVFVDFAKGLRITVDHLKKRVIKEESIEIDEELSSVYDQLTDYINKKYPNEVNIGVFANANDTIQVIIVGERQNPSNFWNGRWISNYEVSLTEKKIEGEIKLDVHYYEDGNVRLTNSKTISSMTFTSESKLVDTINKIEDDLQTSLNRSFLKLNESSFKNLRRQLPVTRSKINWGKSIGTYRLGKDIANE